MPRKKSPNGAGRLGRDKKKKALEGDKYKKALEQLAKLSIQPEQIEAIYNRCQEKKQSKVSRDTLAIKLVELLQYFNSRNYNISEKSKGYISNEDVVQMILKNPRLMSSDIINNIIPKCSIITQKNEGNLELANIKIKSNPGVFRKTINNIKEGR